jgi:simple sugar transport system permease protein
MIDQIIVSAFFTELLGSGIRMATPLLYTGLGELYSERAGITNIGLEGLMVTGAMSAFIGTSLSGNLAVGLLVSVFCGIVINMFFAYTVIIRGGNQIVLGMALNIMAAGLASFVYRSIFGISAMPSKVQGFTRLPIPLLRNIPVAGEIFNQNILVYLAYILVPVSTFILFYTKPGLRLRSVGEHPKTADSLGINVYFQRFLGCAAGGALGALGGAYLSIGYMNMYVENIVAGRGFIALAAVIFGKWKPGGVLLAALLFGFVDALQLRLQAMSLALPYQFMAVLPYVVTLISLIGFVGNSTGPASNGTNYVREDAFKTQ